MLALPRAALGALAAALCSVAAAPAHAFCGFYAGKADASLFNEASQVVLVRDGQRTVLSMLNDYSGPLKEFALIVPTPVTLKQGQVRVAEKVMFERLDAYSSPRLAEYHDQNPCQFRMDWSEDLYPRPPVPVAMAAAPMMADRAGTLARNKALGVTVEAKYTLEEYDIVSLSAKQSDGLEIWLRENGYRIPRGASAALKPYINQGMKFFVAKVNLKEQAKLGYSHLRPLQFAFESEKFMLPMRLGMLNASPNKPQDLIVYALTREGRVESSNYRTVKLAANENLPHFIKPHFKDFYKALFDTSAQREDYRVAFTEYFWDMSWCDPCAANPLSPEELRQAGVFWLDGQADEAFKRLQVPAPSRLPPMVLPPGGGAQPVMLTRLHVRYTPATFPDDLAFTQTKDRQNFQTRYVVHNPYAGSQAQCAAEMGKQECEALCKPKVERVLDRLKALDPATLAKPARNPRWEGNPQAYAGKSEAQLAQECAESCNASKRSTLESARRYYEEQVPARIKQESLTLAKLTGWSLADIDKLGRGEGKPPTANSSGSGKPVAATWWERLFAPRPSAATAVVTNGQTPG
ncbi:DUF2330 domain-containing protein [Ideonella paludis]|uniref:DUF2330 domain-containing protein n=1 Tax=Ideonella paludis TaxID=1233411 RepID=A0ABS5E1H9_9BURK|nr:DUF2330 domain-containing protein [Ideonella paludis]MBQ0937272.1 DUF2330 domain-containing protein [Ideonella paludis]